MLAGFKVGFFDYESGFHSESRSEVYNQYVELGEILQSAVKMGTIYMFTRNGVKIRA